MRTREEKALYTVKHYEAPVRTVLFGGKTDSEMNLSEKLYDCGIEEKILNRSFEELSLENASSMYDTWVALTNPSKLFLHIGEADKELFKKNKGEFKLAYMNLIGHIRMLNPNCEISLLSIKHSGDDELVDEMNDVIERVAKVTKCGFYDVMSFKSYDPSQIRFLHEYTFAMGGKKKTSDYDMLKVIFGYDPQRFA